VAAADKSRVEGLIRDLRQAIEQNNIDRMKSLTNEIQQALMQIGSAVYSQAGASPNSGSSPNGSNATDSGSSNEDVIDADFVEHR
jgi:molecular chaperone DnaK